MSPSTEVTQLPSAPHHQAIIANGVPAASYAFLSKPPKPKHRPHPIAIRCTSSRSPSRSTSSRRRASFSGSPAFQTSFLSLTPTAPPDTPRTPHLTNYGYTTAFATYPRRGLALEDVHIAPARRAPISPKRASSPKSAPNSPKRLHASGSPKRRQHLASSPSSPFAPPSPTRTRARAQSITRTPVPIQPTLSAPRTPKLSKIRSFTNLRARSLAPAPPSRTFASKPTMNDPSTTPKTTSKRAKRSATPARGSPAFTKYRPMPFIQQMQMIQFLEGGSLDSHIRKHHVHVGQDSVPAGFPTDGNGEISHGYTFTDERGMIWFDEEEEWEFACLLPKTTRPQRRRGIKRLLGKRHSEESEDDWEEFGPADEEAEEEGSMDLTTLLARENDELRARDDELASFGGSLTGAWVRDRPIQSVLGLPDPKVERRRKRVGRIISSVPTPSPGPGPKQPQSSHERTLRLKTEFLASAFAPPPAQALPTRAAPPSRIIGPFRMFTRAAVATDSNAPRTLFQRHKRAGRSVPNIAAASGQSFVSLSTSLKGGDTLDAPTHSETPQSPTVRWANMDDEPLPPVLSSLAPTAVEIPPSFPSNCGMHLRSVSPPPAAARRLGIDPSTAVSLQPSATTVKKQTFGSLRGFKSSRND